MDYSKVLPSSRSLAIIGASVGVNICALALPVMMIQLYDRVIPNSAYGTLAVLMAIVFTAVVIEGCLRSGRSILTAVQAAEADHRSGSRALSALLRRPSEELGPAALGPGVDGFFTEAVAPPAQKLERLITITDIVFVPLFLVGIAVMTGLGVLGPIIVLLIYALTEIRIRRHDRAPSLQRRELVQQRMAFLIDTLRAIGTVKIHGAEKRLARRYDEWCARIGLANQNETKRQWAHVDRAALAQTAMILGMVAAGGLSAVFGASSAGALVGAIILSARLTTPVERVIALCLPNTPPRELIERASDTEDKALPAPEVLFPEGRLEIRRLGYRPHPDAPFVFDGLSLTITRGEAVLLEGPAGSGKTSLLELIAGIRSPQQGDIRVDGCSLHAFPVDRLNQHVAYLRTTPILFRGTLRENITAFGRLPEAAVREIAQLLHVTRDVARLPLGFDTQVETSSADGISLGLKQRISFVRALALKPRLILFDNADKYLDEEGYQAIFRLLAKVRGKASLLIVAGDPAMRELAERRLELRLPTSRALQVAA